MCLAHNILGILHLNQLENCTRISITSTAARWSWKIFVVLACFAVAIAPTMAEAPNYLIESESFPFQPTQETDPEVCEFALHRPVCSSRFFDLSFQHPLRTFKPTFANIQFKVVGSPPAWNSRAAFHIILRC